MNFKKIISGFDKYLSLEFFTSSIKCYSSTSGFRFILYQTEFSKPVSCTILNFLHDCSPDELLYFITLYHKPEDFIRIHGISFQDEREMQFESTVSRDEAIGIAFSLYRLSLSDDDYELADSEDNLVLPDYDEILNIFSDFSLYGNTYVTDEGLGCLPMFYNPKQPTINNFVYFNSSSVRYSNPTSFSSFYLSKPFSNQHYLSICVNPFYFAKFFYNIFTSGTDDLTLIEKYQDHRLFVIPTNPSISISKQLLDLVNEDLFSSFYYYHSNDMVSLVSLIMLCNNLFSLKKHIHISHQANQNYILLSFFLYPKYCGTSPQELISFFTYLQDKYKSVPIFLTPKLLFSTNYPSNPDLPSPITPLSLLVYLPLSPHIILDYCKLIFNSLNISFHFRFVD